MVSKLNILFVSSWFPSTEKPTLGNFVETHAKAIARHHLVNVLYATKRHQKPLFSYEERQDNNLKIGIMYYRASRIGISLLDKLIDAIRHLQSYNRLFRQLEKTPDLVHANIVWPIGLWALWLKFRYGLKFILTEHWSVYQPENRHKISCLQKILFKRIINKASVLTPVSSQLGEAIRGIGIDKPYRVVPNAIDTQLFRFKPKEKTATFSFLHISTLVDEVKNVSGILRAFQQLLQVDSDNSLTIVSDGDITPFVNYVETLSIPKDKITFIGTQTAEQIAEHFYRANVFVLFSNYENLPVVILEAFATGTPVISTNVGGISEHFPDGFGELIPKQDEQALLTSMIKLKANYSTSSFNTLSEYAEKMFSFNSVAQAYSNIYKDILT